MVSRPRVAHWLRQEEGNQPKAFVSPARSGRRVDRPHSRFALFYGGYVSFVQVERPWKDPVFGLPSGRIRAHPSHAGESAVHGGGVPWHARHVDGGRGTSEGKKSRFGVGLINVDPGLTPGFC